MAQSAPATAQTIEAYVGETMDAARMGPIHWQVLALVASGLFFDVLDFTIFGALVPDLIKSGFVTQAQVPWDRQRHSGRAVCRHAKRRWAPRRAASSRRFEDVGAADRIEIGGAAAHPKTPRRAR